MPVDRDYLPDHRQEAELRRPYEEGYFASTPTRWRRILRTFLPWQLWRFAAINVRMLRMVGKRHHGAKGPRPDARQAGDGSGEAGRRLTRRPSRPG